MIQGNNTHTQQADSFDEAYNVAVGMKKEFDNAYEKWAKKRGIQVGWKKRMNSNFVSDKNRKKE